MPAENACFRRRKKKDQISLRNSGLATKKAKQELNLVRLLTAHKKRLPGLIQNLRMKQPGFRDKEKGKSKAGGKKRKAKQTAR